MPISDDGTISAAQPTYSTRVTVEAVYSASGEAGALIMHARIMGLLASFVEQIDQEAKTAGHDMLFQLGYAKTPSLVSPEGEGSEDGGSVNENMGWY